MNEEEEARIKVITENTEGPLNELENLKYKLITKLKYTGYKLWYDEIVDNLYEAVENLNNGKDFTKEENTLLGYLEKYKDYLNK